jgi:hypothetical protein
MDTVPVHASAPGKRPVARAAATWFAVTLGGSAVLGLLCGLIWGEVAPRALLQEVGAGTAEVVNAETTAFIAADAWFCAIAAAAGLITGVLGYWFLLAPRDGARSQRGVRAATTLGLILGALAGALVMLWLGERIGLSGYDHHLATSPNGTFFSASLSLGAKSALVFWPMFTAIVILIAEWGIRRPERPRHQEHQGHQDRPDRPADPEAPAATG